MQASQPVLLTIVESFQHSQAFARRGARQAGSGGGVGALENAVVGEVQEKKERSVGLSALNASESTCPADNY